MIEIKNLSYSYKNKEKVLENINLKIKEGEVVSVIGKNGSRKINSRKTYFRHYETD